MTENNYEDEEARWRRVEALLEEALVPEEELAKERQRLEEEKRGSGHRNTDTDSRHREVSAKIAADLEQWGYDLWMNELDDSVWNGQERWTDAAHATLRMLARDNGYAQDRLLSALDDSILAIASSHRRHPLREYLDSLKWDGEDHIATLAKYFQDEHPTIEYKSGKKQTVFHAFLTRWLVGSVAKIYGDVKAARSNFVLVLAGGQDIGKSHFSEWLCPLPEYFAEGSINPDNKDCSLRRTNTWIWEISELGATTRRADVEALKSFITVTEVRERRPYARYDVTKPAIASYIGTVNPDGAGFLLDSTGNRRFAVVELKSIDWKYEGVSLEQVWAQARAMYMADRVAYRMAPEEAQMRSRNAEAHTGPDIFADALAKTYEINPDMSGVPGWRQTTAEILERLRTFGGLSRSNDISQARALARSLREHWGITGKRSHGVTYYEGLSPKSDLQRD
jgi:predicted P-loop ATPase